MSNRDRNPLVAGSISLAHVGMFVAAWVLLVIAEMGFCFIATNSLLLPFTMETHGESRAKMDAMSLEKAVMIYQVRHERWPESLAELTKPDLDGTTLLEPTAMIDPWGNPYHYDRNLLHPKTKKPLIWTDGPPGRNQPVRNWK